MDYRNAELKFKWNRTLLTIYLEIAYELSAIELKITKTLSVMRTCFPQNPIFLSQRDTISEHPTRSNLMPKPPKFGNFCAQTKRKTFHQGPPSILTDTQLNQE